MYPGLDTYILSMFFLQWIVNVYYLYYFEYMLFR